MSFFPVFDVHTVFGICFKVHSSPKGRRCGDRTMGEAGTANGWWLKLAGGLRAAATLPLCDFCGGSTFSR